jgi:hypothetical protein
MPVAVDPACSFTQRDAASCLYEIKRMRGRVCVRIRTEHCGARRAWQKASGNFKGKASFGWSRWKNERSPIFSSFILPCEYFVSDLEILAKIYPKHFL